MSMFVQIRVILTVGTISYADYSGINLSAIAIWCSFSVLNDGKLDIAQAVRLILIMLLSNYIKQTKALCFFIG